VINLLQCRPLQSFKGTGTVEVPAASSGPVLLRSADNTMGGSIRAAIDFVCVVDAAAYRACPHVKRPGVARAVGEAGRRIHVAASETSILLAP
jgi:pyruvate,water dikinase